MGARLWTGRGEPPICRVCERPVHVALTRARAQDAWFCPCRAEPPCGTLPAIPMSTLLLTDQANPQCVVCEPGRTRTRVWTRLHANRLDRALAAGTSPDSSASLLLRAQTLIGARARAWLSRIVRSLIDQARRPNYPATPSIPLCRRKVLAARETIEELADRLLTGDPVDAQGVAQIHLLLTDAYGPLYRHPAADDLQPALRAVIEALDVRV